MFLKECLPSVADEPVKIFHLFSGQNIFHIQHEWEIPPEPLQSSCVVSGFLPRAKNLAFIRFGDSRWFSACAWFPRVAGKSKVCYCPSISTNRKISLEDRRGKPDSLLWALNRMGLSSHDTWAPGASHSPDAWNATQLNLLQRNHQVRSTRMQCPSMGFLPLTPYYCQEVFIHPLQNCCILGKSRVLVLSILLQSSPASSLEKRTVILY